MDASEENQSRRLIAPPSYLEALNKLSERCPLYPLPPIEDCEQFERAYPDLDRRYQFCLMSCKGRSTSLMQLIRRQQSMAPIQAACLRHRRRLTTPT